MYKDSLAQLTIFVGPTEGVYDETLIEKERDQAGSVIVL